MAEERAGAFDFGKPMTLLGPELQVGDKAPSFTLAGPRNEPIESARFAGKPLVISVVPSIERASARARPAASTKRPRA